MVTIQDALHDLRLVATTERAKTSEWFFKTGPGEYGEGDIFIGVTLPDLRRIAKKYIQCSLNELEILLKSPVHEERLLALIILVNQYNKSVTENQKEIYNFYIVHISSINNWDLVDCSAPSIVGAYLYNKPKTILNKMAASSNVWERRIAIISTFYFIKKHHAETSMTIASLLLHDTHDLIHKAVGWMLREVGKHCGEEIEEVFLKRYYQEMPRTMLRYSIERFPETKKKLYMKRKI